MRVAEPEEEIGADRGLALHYAAHRDRDALRALWMLDARMRRIFTTARQPAVAQIKLAWWRERLAELRHGAPPAEPLLVRLEEAFAVSGSAARALPAIAEAWRELPDDEPWGVDVLVPYARARGRGILAACAEVAQAAPSERHFLASEGQALADLATYAPDPKTRELIIVAARGCFDDAGRLVWPRRLRAPGIIVELARGDIRAGRVPPEGSPARVARIVWHGLTGC